MLAFEKLLQCEFDCVNTEDLQKRFKSKKIFIRKLNEAAALRWTAGWVKLYESQKKKQPIWS